MVRKYLNQCHFPRRCGGWLGRNSYLCTPGVVAGRGHAQHPTEHAHGVINTLLVNELVTTHEVGGVLKMAMAFFKIFNACAKRLLAVRNWRTSAASAGSVGSAGNASCCHL
jgi:hypothetical protein